MDADLEMVLRRFVRTHDAPDPAYSMEPWEGLVEVSNTYRLVVLNNARYFVREAVFTRDYVAPVDLNSPHEWTAVMTPMGALYRRKKLFQIMGGCLPEEEKTS